MSSPAELSLDYKPGNGYMMAHKLLPAPAAGGDPPADQSTEKIQDFLVRLEEERLKIEAFKRELPLCMQLLNNAVETYKNQLELQTKQQREQQQQQQHHQIQRPVLEEFIPIKTAALDATVNPPNIPSEKSSWMVSAQLWSQANDAAVVAAATVKEETVVASPKLLLESKPVRNGNGAFLPFSKEKSKVSVVSGGGGGVELGLASSEQQQKGNCEGEEKKVSSGNSGDGQAGQAHRKARRCWSPDLHRRFVNALQILGGSQVATPKQIRELMKVDGLTNDEVKSHLQKYRLHTRRPMPVPQPTAAAAPQLVVLGGIWVPPEYATSAAGPAIYGAHAPPPHYCAPVPQDYYAAAAHHHPHAGHHHIQQPTTVHRTSGIGGHKGRASRSPESEVRSGGERSESIEEEAEEEDEENVDEDEDEEFEDEKEKKADGGASNNY